MDEVMKQKTAACEGRGFYEKSLKGLLFSALGLLGGKGYGDLPTFEIGFAAFTFDDFVGLLAHGVRGVKRFRIAKGGGGSQASE